jgi:protein-disulfide isomerase
VAILSSPNSHPHLVAASVTYLRKVQMQRSTPHRVSLILGMLALGAGQLGCANQESAAASSNSGAEPSTADIPAVLATIGNDKITMADVRTRVGDELDQNEARYQRARHALIESALQQILQDRVLRTEAKKQNTTVLKLLTAEAGGSLEPSEVEIAAWFKENRTRTGGRTLDQIQGEIGDYLRDQRRKDAAERLQTRLNAEQKVTVNLEPYRVQIDNEGAPAIGPADAPVTLVEFSDFECPFCGRFFPTLKRLEEKFGDSLRIVYRHYPIAKLHPNAMKAAEASLCAHDEGKFWDLHDLMFQEQKRLAVKDLKVKASRAGLDQKKFDTCLDSGRHAARVQKDFDEASSLGVTGTPALFLNGIPIEGGAVSYEVAVKAIEKELARVKR